MKGGFLTYITWSFPSAIFNTLYNFYNSAECNWKLWNGNHTVLCFPFAENERKETVIRYNLSSVLTSCVLPSFKVQK